MPAVGGFVFDSAGAPVDRELRFYRRDTGGLLGKSRSSGGDGDPDFDKVSLLLHMDGADGSTVITDSSQRPKTVTAMGDAKISTAQGLFGGASGYLDGSGGYLIFPHGPDFDFGTGAFTIEFFLYRAGGTICVLVSSRESLPQGTKGQLEIGINENNALYFFDGTNAFASSLSIQNNVWSHCAFCSPGNGQVSIFIGGALAFSGTGETAWTHTSNWMVGRWAGGAQYNYQGYLCELRVTKGLARYTSNFTPPSTPFPDMSGAGRTLAFGEYYFVTTHTGEVQVVCMDDANEPLENDLILRTFPV